MLYRYPLFKDHISYRLNRNILYFFSKLRRVDDKSNFSPLTNYFSADFVVFLRSRKQDKLRSLFSNFFEAFKSLTQGEKTSVISLFKDAQKIDAILSIDTIECHDYCIDRLPDAIQIPTRRLFEYLFSTTLNSYGKLKEHYKLIFEALEINVCPFCGIELLTKPSIVRQDYDHLMKQSTYTFTSVNMNNLVPTGTECNRINKHSIDAVYYNNQRSVFNSPYLNTFDIRISLAGSTPSTTIEGEGTWIITIHPNNEYTRQWEYVYNIRARYTDNVLHKFYKQWMKEFRTYLINRQLIPVSSHSLEIELNTQAVTLLAHPTGLMNMVRGAFYEFLATHREQVYRGSIVKYFNS